MYKMMKAYTDLEQSKKLAKILALETADMYYEDDISVEFGHGWHPQHFPCWSLAALLSVISEVSLNTFKDKKWNVMIKHDSKMIYVDKDNPVDACVELIEKLYELKIL